MNLFVDFFLWAIFGIIFLSGVTILNGAVSIIGAIQRNNQIDEDLISAYKNEYDALNSIRTNINSTTLSINSLFINLRNLENYNNRFYGQISKTTLSANTTYPVTASSRAINPNITTTYLASMLQPYSSIRDDLYIIYIIHAVIYNEISEKFSIFALNYDVNTDHPLSLFNQALLYSLAGYTAIMSSTIYYFLQHITGIKYNVANIGDKDRGPNSVLSPNSLFGQYLELSSIRFQSYTVAITNFNASISTYNIVTRNYNTSVNTTTFNLDRALYANTNALRVFVFAEYVNNLKNSDNSIDNSIDTTYRYSDTTDSTNNDTPLSILWDITGNIVQTQNASSITAPLIYI